MNNPNRPKNESRSPLPTLEEFIREKEILGPFDIVRAQHCMKDNQVNFSTALQFLKILSADQLGKFLRESYSVHKIEMSAIQIQARFKSLISGEKAKIWQAIPLNLIDDSGQKILLVGMTDPLDVNTLRKLEAACHMKVQPAFLGLDDLQALLKKYYRLSLEIFPPEITSFGEITVNRRMEAVTRDAKPLRSVPKINPVMVSKEMAVLVQLLIKKGILSLSEFEDALNS